MRNPKSPKRNVSSPHGLAAAGDLPRSEFLLPEAQQKEKPQQPHHEQHEFWMLVHLDEEPPPPPPPVQQQQTPAGRDRSETTGDLPRRASAHA